MALRRIALVTGAAQGIGRAIALRLGIDGYDIAITDLETQKDKLELTRQEIESGRRRCITLYGDVSVETSVVHMIEKTVQDLGGLDVVKHGNIFSCGVV